MKGQVFAAALTTLAVTAPLAVYGQETYNRDEWWDNRWYVTPFAGYVFSDSDRQADDGWQVGVGVGKPVSPKWNLELRGFYEELDDKDSGPGKYKNWGGTIDAQWYFLRKRGIDNWDRFQPYIVAGIGGIRDKVSGQDDYSFMANAGAGFNWAFSEWGRLVGDARYRWDNNAGDIAKGSNFDDVIVSVGLQVPLGPKPLVAAPVAAPVVAPVVREEPTVEETMFELSADGMFAFDRYELTAEGRNRIDEVIEIVRRVGFTATSILVTGHTDPLGSEEYNQGLSERRAAVVAHYLVSQGISPNIVQTEGRGETQLKVTEADCRAQGKGQPRSALIACLAPNRRVEAVVKGMQSS